MKLTTASSDQILILNLEVRCLIGTFRHERTKKQSVYFDLQIPCDAAKPARRDDLHEALDYDRLTRRLREYAGTTRFFLIETLAERSAAILLKEFGLSRIRITIWKPGAINGCANVGISIERRADKKSPKGKH
jgi:dihydroneopterin aldolase